MAISVNTSNVTVSTPVQVEITDRSGAHVEVTVAFQNEPPITHAFSFHEGSLATSVELKPGAHLCTFEIKAFFFKDLNTLNRNVNVTVTANGQTVATATGSIDTARSNEFNFGDFTVTVTP